MTELCILFLHHRDDAVTRDHAARLRRHNPGAAFIPLIFGAGLPGAVRPALPPEPPSACAYSLRQRAHEQWRNIDRLIWAWARSPARVQARRYIVAEYDACCTGPLRDFYAPCWDAEVAAASILTRQDCPHWNWFREVKAPETFGKNLLGLAPFCGLFLSEEALLTLATASLGAIYRPLLSELRVGTMARAAGLSPVLIRPDIGEFISSGPRRPDGRPGLWHTVKSIHKNL